MKRDNRLALYTFYVLYGTIACNYLDPLATGQLTSGHFT